MLRARLLVLLASIPFWLSCSDDDVACTFTFNKVRYRATSVDCSHGYYFSGAVLANGTAFKLVIGKDSLGTQVKFYPGEGPDYFTSSDNCAILYQGDVEFDCLLVNQGTPVGRLTGRCTCTSLIME